MLAEAVAREARRVLPVPLDQLYLSWRQIPSPKGRLQAFLGAVPRQTADSLIKTLKIAGLEASHMAFKPLALTGAVPEDTVIGCPPNEFDIAPRVPQPIRTITLPDTDSPDKEDC
jgi:Tfp pilus assembly PilM family ATPase